MTDLGRSLPLPEGRGQSTQMTRKSPAVSARPGFRMANWTAAVAPVITAVSVSPATVQAPGQVTISYTAQSESPIAYAIAGYVDTRNRYRAITLSPGATLRPE